MTVYRLKYMYTPEQLRAYAHQLEKVGFTKAQIKALLQLLFHTAIDDNPKGNDDIIDALTECFV